MSLTVPAAGTYRPNCTHCQRKFRLKVTSDDPPKIGVGRIKDAMDQPAAGTQPVVAQPQSSALGQMPQRLGGYRIIRQIGRGAMGAVYEAKQISLDRQVALKTIRDRWTDSPASLARFVREAYAAAQLTHHNVVQIYDFGEEGGRYYFSMEWVRGGPLDAVVRQKGALDPRLAAGYALQAARGLQFAHRHGMVHRDVKPANLLLSDEGVIKVADLGLVKIPDHAEIETESGLVTSGGIYSGTEVTIQGTAVGTPAYMSPEQAADAARVDHRADIYSLGCTLFFLLTGRPPFDGSVASEVMEQHARTTAPDVRKVNARVPQPLADIIARSIAKRPADRYPSLVQCIHDLEQFLGLESEGDFSPSSVQADRWERIAAQHASVGSLQRIDTLAFAGFAALSILVSLATFTIEMDWWLLGITLWVAGVGVTISLAGNRSPVVARTRSWLGSLSMIELAAGWMGVSALVLIVIAAGMWPGLLAGAIIGSVMALGYHLGVVGPIEERRSQSLSEAERFLRDLRISGADEQGLRLFTARYGGARWQPLFESLFGYDALLAVREALKNDPALAGKIGGSSLRDRLCANLMLRTTVNHHRTQQKRLAKIEKAGLQSEGMNAAEAEKRSWAIADAVMQNAHYTLQPSTDSDAVAVAKRARMRAMLADARSGNYQVMRDRSTPLRFALGAPTRLIVGCGLLSIFAIWGNHQGLFESIKDIETLKQIGSGSADYNSLGSAVRDAAMSASDGGDASMMGKGINPWSIGVAGLLMAMSAFVSGWRMSIPATIATIVILLGPQIGISGWGDIVPPWMVAAGIGLLIYVPGIIFGETET
ncbi:Serine/threonine-protein kinase PrkC [Rubripirellula lacrimiformis]|uniref:Serine/threonine-protein kinase PrkC n=2 Tax=Rubripirellula lacrimiformis TaxID=1930273 RepID=A0A517N3M1_9BACT|nr:Serine/threonine-protein kinase PrkC [Rubripirellula lacrimiformis]